MFKKNMKKNSTLGVGARRPALEPPLIQNELSIQNVY
jgi:hypothetical protein